MVVTNGTDNARPLLAPPPGIYVPAVTFFDPDKDTLLVEQQAQYYSYLARTGLTGLVILGTNAETFLLTREERATLLQLARQSVPADYPIIAGVGGHSTAQVLEFIADARTASGLFRQTDDAVRGQQILRRYRQCFSASYHYIQLPSRLQRPRP